MYLENIALAKEYGESFKESYFIACDSFENSMQQMEYFYPTRHISRGQVCAMEDEKSVSLVDYPDGWFIFCSGVLVTNVFCNFNR